MQALLSALARGQNSCMNGVKAAASAGQNWTWEKLILPLLNESRRSAPSTQPMWATKARGHTYDWIEVASVLKNDALQALMAALERGQSPCVAGVKQQRVLARNGTWKQLVLPRY